MFPPVKQSLPALIGRACSDRRCGRCGSCGLALTRRLLLERLEIVPDELDRASLGALDRLIAEPVGHLRAAMAPRSRSAWRRNAVQPGCACQGPPPSPPPPWARGCGRSGQL